MKNIVFFISVFFMALPYSSYSQSSNNFSGYIIGGAGIFNSQTDFTNRMNFSPAAGLNLNLKRFTLGLEGSTLKARFNDLLDLSNMGQYVPEITGSNEYKTTRLLFGPGYDIIKGKKIKLNFSTLVGMNWVKQESQTVNLTISELAQKPTFLLAKRVAVDASDSKFVFSPSLNLKFAASKNVEFVLKTSYLFAGTTNYEYVTRNFNGVMWTDKLQKILIFLDTHPPKTSQAEYNLSNLFLGAGVNITLWNKDRPKKKKDLPCPSDMSVCVGQEDFLLTGGLPAGGTYSGKGVTNGMFSPAAADTGAHLINYTPPGDLNPCSFKITVKPRPKLTCPADTTVSYNSGEFELKNCTPAGGEYSGKGVSEGKFNPVIAGVGADTVTYVYKEDESCMDSCRFVIHVIKYYYDLSKDPYGSSVEISGDTLNVQYTNNYASSSDIYLGIFGINARDKIEKKTTKKQSAREPKLYNLNGLNRISIGLKNYMLQSGELYQLTISDSKNYYYLNFKVNRPQIIPGNSIPKNNINDFKIR